MATLTNGTQEEAESMTGSHLKMKDEEWHAQLSEIENHLESMMVRALNYD